MADLAFEKICVKCYKVLPISEFNTDNQSADGLSGYCKKCNAERAKEWREQNKDRAREYKRKYRQRKKRKKLFANG